MKIGPNLEPGRPGNAGSTGSARTDSKQSTTPIAITPSGATTVQLSEVSARLGGVDALAASSAPFDGTRVEAIKSAISDGKFKVNAGVVADRLIASVQAMLTQAGRRT